MSSKVFKTADEITKPENINKALNDLDRDIDNKISLNKGKVNSTARIITAENIPDIGTDEILLEQNDTNKRIHVKINGKMYYADLTELT